MHDAELVEDGWNLPSPSALDRAEALAIRAASEEDGEDVREVGSSLPGGYPCVPIREPTVPEQSAS